MDHEKMSLPDQLVHSKF